MIRHNSLPADIRVGMLCKISQIEDYLLTYEHIFNCYKTITNYCNSSLNITRNLIYYKSITIFQAQI